MAIKRKAVAKSVTKAKAVKITKAVTSKVLVAEKSEPRGFLGLFKPKKKKPEVQIKGKYTPLPVKPYGEPKRVGLKTVVGSFKAYPGSAFELTPGTVAVFRYVGEDSHEPRPTVIVFSDGFYKGLLHAINLMYLDKATLKKLRDVIKDNKDRIGNPKAFYDSTLKHFLSSLGDRGINAYRTYKKSGISAIRIFDMDIFDIQ